MVMPKLPPGERRSEPVFVLLRPRELQQVDKIAEKEGKSRAQVLRESFLDRHTQVDAP
ncbi:hypothetical protein LCGC14_0768560 [marine sediment metagenome]|uniref:Ribbon-helix-helix protein CopG domain-containing protein n=1 Tax=marine sediment metagenome TaxID=412755 RepID=A0A0F9T5X2_9ZZZZ